MAEISLFDQIDGLLEFKRLLDEIRDEVYRKSNDYILNVNLEEWKNYFLNKYDFLPLTIYPENIQSFLVSKYTEGNKGTKVDYYKIRIEIPFTGSSLLFSIRPSTCTMLHPIVNVPQGDSGNISAIIIVPENNSSQFENEMRNIIMALTSNAKNINNDLQLFKNQVIKTFYSSYNQKKAKVLAEKSFFERLNITIDSSTDSLYTVPILEKKKIPEPIIDQKSPKKFSNTPVFDDKYYEDILDVINRFFKSVEKKPSIYLSRDEESLRDYILPTLELRYNNTAATGETFNKNGSTDILLKYTDGTNLFVAECKFWKGQEVFHQTIHQLFDRYLTWRDSKVAIIFFVKNKDFSNVLRVINESVVKHPYFVKENGAHGESSFSYIFHFPTDTGKFIYTEIMAFHFPEQGN